MEELPGTVVCPLSCDIKWWSIIIMQMSIIFVVRREFFGGIKFNAPAKRLDGL